MRIALDADRRSRAARRRVLAAALVAAAAAESGAPRDPHSARRRRRRLPAAARDAGARADREARARRGRRGASRCAGSSSAGPAVMNDALLSGSVDFIAAGPPAFITLWDRTRGSADVRGVAAMSSLPMYLNTTRRALTTLDDLTATGQDRGHGRQGVDPVDQHADVRGGALRHGRGVPLRPLHRDDDACRRRRSRCSRARTRSTRTSPRRRSISARSRTRACARCSTPTTIMGGATTFTMLSTTARFRDAESRELYAAVLAALEEANELIRSRQPRGRGDPVRGRGRRGLLGRRARRGAARPRHPIHDDAREHAEVRRVHARDRLDREPARIVARSVLPRDPWQPGQLSRRRAPHPRRCSA